MRSFLACVFILTPRSHAHLRRDIPTMGKADHDELTKVTNVTNATNVTKTTNAMNVTNVVTETNVTNATSAIYVNNDILIHTDPDPLATNMVNVTLAGRTEDRTYGSEKAAESPAFPAFRGDIRGVTGDGNFSVNATMDRYDHHRAEYYGTVVSCAGKTFLLTRLDLGMWHGKGWQTRVRDLGHFHKNVLELPSRILAYNTLSHNVAALCVNDEVILVGGQFRSDRSEPHWQGVHVSRTKPTNLDTFAQISRPKRLFTGHHGGCVEKRPDHRYSGCEFDGRFSLIHFRDRFLLFARANIPTRYVQVTSSADLETWSRFQLIDVEGVKQRDEIMMYFLTAAVMEKDEWIAGYFPGFIVDKASHRMKSAGVHITWSKDGVQWVKPHSVSSCDAAPRHFTSDEDRKRLNSCFYMKHPVGMINNRLMLQAATRIREAFQISQEFRKGHLLEDMNETLQLTVLGRKYELLGAPVGDPIVYNEELWNE